MVANVNGNTTTQVTELQTYAGMQKYRNKKTVVDNVTFHSIKEADRYVYLKMLLRSGEITDLELQPKYPLVVNGQKICVYYADFRFKDRSGKVIVEDVKGLRTKDYIIKRKLFDVLYAPLHITEI